MVQGRGDKNGPGVGAKDFQGGSCPPTSLAYVNPHNRLFLSYMVIQVVLYLNLHLTIDCSPLLDSLGDVHIFQILFK